MNRAHTDDSDEVVVLALARYILRKYPVDPNPSGQATAPAAEPRRIAHEPKSATPPPLVGDNEYSIKEAALILGLAEVTLRKRINKKRLAARKEGTRIFLLGTDIAAILAQRTREAQPEDDETSPDG